MYVTNVDIISQTPSQCNNSVNYTIYYRRMYMLITGTEYRCDSGVWSLAWDSGCLMDFDDTSTVWGLDCIETGDNVCTGVHMEFELILGY